MKSEQTLQREENLKKMEGLGFGAKAYSYAINHHSNEVIQRFEALETSGDEVSIAGRVMSIRSHGKSAFAHIQDIGGRVQVYFKLSNLGDDSYGATKLLDVGDHLGISGRVFKTRTGEVTLEVKTWELLAKCLHPFP